MPTSLGVIFFWGGAEALLKQGRQIRYRNSLSKFAEKFAGTFPKNSQAKIKNSPQIRSAELREIPGKSPNVLNSRIWGTGKDKPAANHGVTLPRTLSTPTLRCWESAKNIAQRVFALLTPEIRS